MQNERSLKEVLKEVLTVSDFRKTMPIIEYLEENSEISPKEVERITGKSASTAWRYLKILVDAGIVEAEGGTNNIVYRLVASYQN